MKKPVRTSLNAKPKHAAYSQYLALENRLVFDGAAVATVDAVQPDNIDKPVTDNTSTAAPAIEPPVNFLPEKAASVVDFQPSADSTTDSPAFFIEPDPLESMNVAMTPVMDVKGDNAATSVIVVDPRADNAAALLTNPPANTQILTLDTTRDGFQQIAAYLQTRHDVTQLDILAWSDGNKQWLGNKALTGTIEASVSHELALWGDGLTDKANIVFHGADKLSTGWLNYIDALTGGTSSWSQDDIALTAPVPQRSEIVFIENNIADYQTLVNSVNPNAEVYVLDASQDGLAQMAQILNGRTNIDSISILSHGSSGSLFLGSSVLNKVSLTADTDVLKQIGSSLSATGDILLYGCDVAQGDAGLQFISQLGVLTGADIAASTNATGNAALGGDWVLEAKTGDIAAASAFDSLALSSYSGLLPTITAATTGSGIAVIGLGTGDVIGNSFTATTTGTMTSLALLAQETAASTLKIYAGAGTGGTLLYTQAIAANTTHIAGSFTDYSTITLTTPVNITNGSVYTFTVTDGGGWYYFDNTVAGETNYTGGQVYFNGSAQSTYDVVFVINQNTVAANTAPTFVQAGAGTLNINENAAATDIKTLLHISDTDASQTETWTQSVAPSHGTLSFGSATASSGATDIITNGTITYTPTVGYAGTDSFTIQVSDGNGGTATRTINVNVNPLTPSAPDLVAGTDSGSSNTDNRTNAALLNFTGTSAAGDSTNKVRVFIDTNGNGVKDVPEPVASATLSNGNWTLNGLSTAGVADGTYNLYAYTTTSVNTLPSALSSALSITIDKTAPGITSVSIPNVSMKVGDTVTATLTVANDGGDTYTLGSSSIDGFTVSNLIRTSATTYTAQFTVTEGGADIAAASAIPLSLILTDTAGNSNTAYTTAISQAADAINAHTPTNMALSANTILTSAANNAVVGALSSTDGTSGDTFTYTLVAGAGSTDNASFNISGGNIRATTPSGLTAGAKSVRVRTTDAGGNFYEQTFSITVSAPANSNPVSSANTGLTVLEDAAITTITTAMLNVTDVEQAASALTYTLTAASTKGIFSKSGAALGVGGTFTQADINIGLVKYTPNFNANGSDSVGFSVSDGAGGTLNAQTFNFTITPVVDVNIVAGITPVEGATGTFTITLDSAPASNLTINYTLDSPSTATLTTDYTVTAGAGISAVTAGTFTILAGQTTATLNVNALTDAVADPNETVILKLATGAGYQLAATSNSAFLTPTQYALSSSANSVSTGDFNNDGWLDLVTSNINTDTTEVLMGSATGFGTHTIYSLDVGAGPASTTVGDFNGDGKLDFAVGNKYSDTISVFLRNSTNTGFAPKVDYSSIDNRDLNAVDLNGDGKTDLIASHYDNNTVSVFMANASNTFDTAITHDVGGFAMGLSTADFNGDGKIDLVAVTSTGNKISVLLRNTANTDFDAYTRYTTRSGSEGVATGDFNGDGRIDLAVANYSDNTMSVLLRNATNTGFVKEADYATFANPKQVSTADFNGDGKLDLVVTNEDVPGYVSVFLRNTSNTGFNAKVDYTTSNSAIDVAIGDFNHDGRADLAVTTGFSSVSILLNDAAPSATLTITDVLPNTAPTFTGGANTGLTVLEDAAITTITNTMLRVTDAEQAASALTYTLTAASTKGVLSKSGAPIGAGATFTQADINNNLIKYTPNLNANGGDSVSFSVSDGAGGTLSGQTFSFTITPVNDAPVLDSIQSPTLTAINEDVLDASNTGSTVASIVVNGSITDVDYSPITSAPEAIAVSAVDNTNGVWQYKFGAGAWIAFDFTTNSGKALLLDSADSIRFVPNANWNGTVSSGITFYAWDKTTSSAGNYLTVSGNTGGAATLSTATDTASLVVNAVNDVPTFTGGANTGMTILEDAGITTITTAMLNVTDAEQAAAALTYTITVAANKGILSKSGVPIGAGATFTQADINNGLIKFTPDLNANGGDSLSFSVSDGAGGTLSGQAFNFTITPVADTPSVTNATTATGIQTTSGLVVSRNAFDGAEVTYFKITNIANGTLFLNNGTTAVANNSFITFAQANAGLKFTPSGASNGTFDVQAATSNIDAGLGGSVSTATISVSDAIPPDTSLTATPASLSNSNTASFSFTGTDNVAVTGFEGQLDGGGYVAVTSPKTYSGLTDGSHTFNVRARDAAGNVDLTPASYTWTIDTAAPTLGTVTPPATIITAGGTSSTFTITYNDFGSGIDSSSIGSADITITSSVSGATITNASWNAGTATYTITAPGGTWDIADNGTYTLGIAANQVKDLAGNSVALNANVGSFTVNIVANTAPTLGGTFTTAGTVNDNATIMPFSNVTVNDAESNNVSITITYTAANGTLAGAGLTGTAGNYTLTSASLATVQSNLRALVFTPTANQVASGATVATAFTLTPNDGTSNGTANATTLITTTSINDAPTSVGNLTLAAVNENAASPAGAAINSLTGFGFIDVDTGASLTGVAVINSGVGNWQYSTNGGTNWYSIGTVSLANTLVLAPTTLVRYLPLPNYTGTPPALQVKALDNTYAGGFSTAGGAETRVTLDATVNGGTTAISSNSNTLSTIVTDVNPVISNAAVSLIENSITGTAVATVTATNDTNGLIYSISGGNTDVDSDGNLAFSINASTGAITVNDAGDLNFETTPSFSLAVAVDDEDADTTADSTATITVNLQNLDEVAPTITSSATATAINENSGATQVIYNATSTDLGDIATGATAYSLSGTDAALFTINSSTGAVTLTANPNFEAKSSYSFNVVATDAATNASSKAVTLAINNLDEVAPTITSSATATAINENSGAAQVIYTATSTDVGDIATGATAYSLSGADAALFSINSATGAVTLTANPNFEVKSSYSFNVIATDAATNASSKAVTLAINDLNEAPAITSGGTLNVVENSTGTVYTATGTDPDTAQTLSWSISGTDAALFSINSTTGALTFNTVPNFELPADNGADNVYDLTVIATDNGTGNLTASKAVAITVTNVNEAPTTSAPASISVVENVATALTGISFADVDAGNSSVTATLAVNSGTLSAISGGGVTVTGSGTASMTLAGTLANINAFIASSAVSFTSALNSISTVTLSSSLNDNGNSGSGGALSSAVSSTTLTVTGIADTPAVASPTINEDIDSGAIAITRNAADGAEVTHYKITSITGGTLYSDAGFTTAITAGSFIASSGATTNVYFRPTANSNAAGAFTVQASTSNADAGLGGATATSTINITPIADTANVTGSTTTPATQTTSGLVISRNAVDGAEVTHFKITNIANGTLYQNDGVTQITANSFITFAQANAGLKFTPSGISNGNFDVQASTSNADAGLGGAVSTATISLGIAIANANTNEDTGTGAIAITGNTGFYKITGLTTGTLYSDAGFTTPIANGGFIATSGATTNVYFRPAADFNGAAGFTVQGSSSNLDTGLTGNTATSTITVNPVNDAPTGSGNLILLAVDEDTVSPAGAAINTLAGLNFTDVDAGASLSGVAVIANTANATTQGVWQYSTNGGTNWNNIGTVTGNSAVALSATSLVRFVPALNFNGTPPSLAVRALDNTYAEGFTNGAVLVTTNATINGGSSGISANTNTISTSIAAVNDAPVWSGLANTVNFTEDSAAVALGSVITLSDVDLNALSYADATLTLVRNGNANADDVFANTGTLGALTQGGHLTVNGVVIGTVTSNSAGLLTLTFNANATKALVNSALQQITYSNASNTPPASVQIMWLFNDNNTGAQGKGVALNAIRSTTVNITPANDAPIALNDRATVVNGGTLSGSSLLANDSDPENDVLTVNTTPVTNVAHGALTLYANGSYLYQHDGSAAKTDSFVYEITDGHGGKAQATVTMTISGSPLVNQPTGNVVFLNNLSVFFDNFLTSGSLILLSNCNNDMDSDSRYVFEDKKQLLDYQYHGDYSLPPVHLSLYVPLRYHVISVAGILPTQTLIAQEFYVFKIPKRLFQHRNPYETLKFTATSLDGKALPEWIKLNPKTLTFFGLAPKGTHDVRVMMTIGDQYGNKVHSVFTIHVTDKGSVKNVVGEQRRAAGKSGFSEQLYSAGKVSKLQESRRLLNSLNQL